MRDPLPVMLVPGLLCSARLYAGPFLERLAVWAQRWAWTCGIFS